jgi:MFS family permease
LILLSATPNQPHPFYVERIAEASLRNLTPTAAEAVIGAIPITLPHDSGRGFGGITWFLVAIIPLAIGAGLIRPALNSLMIQQAAPGETGTILGVSAAGVSLADAIAPLIGGYIFQVYGASAPFAVGGAVMAALLLISLIVLRLQPLPAAQT